MRYKSIFFFQLIVFFVFGCALIPSQKYFSKKETDSVISKLQYLKIAESESNEAIKQINAAVPRIKNDSSKIFLIRQKAYLYSRLRNEPMVLKSHLESKEYIDKLGDDREKVMYHLALGEVYGHLKMFNFSLNNLEEANALMKSTEKTASVPMYRLAYNAIKQSVLFQSQDYLNCIKFGNKILPELNKIPNEQQRNFMTMNTNQLIAFSHLERKEYPKVRPYLDKAMKFEQGQIFEFQWRNNNALARYLFETGKVDSALTVLNNFAIKEKKSYPDVLADRSSLLAKIYASKKDLKQSELHLQKKDSLTRKNQESEMKAAEESLKFMEEEKDKSLNFKDNLIFYLLIPLLLITVGVLFYFRQRKKQDKVRYEAIIKKLRVENSIESVQENLKSEELNETVEIEIQATSVLSDDKEIEILNGLAKFEEKNKFRDVNLSLSSLASSLKTNRTYLSEVIKKNKGKNFNAYINELRINYIVRKLYNNPEYLNYKISYLAEDCGFVSHSSFATIFKSVLGISPSTFIQNLKEES